MPLQTPRDIHRVTTPAAYRAGVERAMAKRRQAKLDGVVSECADPIAAYIDHGRWVVDCQCGAGNSVDPDWRFAACYGCGRVWTNVQIPLERAAIERVLLVRRELNRNWKPGESVAHLEAENAVHLKGPR